MDPRHPPSHSNSDDQPTIAGPVFAPGFKVAGRYLIQQSIGRGAFGQVYRAQDEMLGRAVAAHRDCHGDNGMRDHAARKSSHHSRAP